MDLANPAEGANDTMGIFSELSSEPADAEVDQNTQNTETPSGTITDNVGDETHKSDTKPQPRRVKAKFGDREVELDVLTDDIDLDLIPKGLMMESDYRNKTTDLSSKRKEIEAERSKLDQVLGELYSHLEFEVKRFDSEEMKELKEYDPDQYYKELGEAEKKVSSYKKYKEDRDNQIQQQNQKFAQEQQRITQEGLQRLPEYIPEWLDQSVQKDDIGKISNFMSSNGFSEQEMSGLTDPRVISALRKAALYDEIQNASLDSKRKTTSPKSARPGTTNVPRDDAELTLAETFYGIK